MERPTKSKRHLKPRQLPPSCLCCGEENPWVLNKVEFTAPFREAEHEFRAEVNQCRHCDAIATTEEQSAAISEQVRDAHWKWNSAKLKAAQKVLGLSLRDLAEKTGVPFATLGRISSGDHPIEATIERLLWMEIDRLTHEQVMERLLHIRQRAFRVTNGSILVKCDLRNVGVYSTVLNTAAQSPVGKTGACSRELPCSVDPYSDLVPA